MGCYDELLEANKKVSINYSEEKNIDDVSVKKIDLDNLISDEEDKNENYTYKNVTFVHEEKYLQELKRLIKLLD